MLGVKYATSINEQFTSSEFQHSTLQNEPKFRELAGAQEISAVTIPKIKSNTEGF